MALYLVQHGKSLPKEADPDQKLSAQGISDATRIAGVAQGYGVKVAQIRHSGKRRARQTAQIMAKHLTPREQPMEIGGLNPTDDVITFARTLSSQNDLMVVGHLPFLSRLVSYLITGSLTTGVFRFQNAGIVCMDQETGSGAWVITWTLMPEIR